MATTYGCDQLIVDCDSVILVEVANKGLYDLRSPHFKMASLEVLFNMCIENPTWLLTLSLSTDFALILEYVEYFEQPPPHVSEFFLYELCEFPRIREVAVAT